ncbi:hypothetical protein [Dysgonomonas macrotermitis]|uniref:Uncharacterized protein n=1 Tax=Dysgonomonas macrotermitis TaxID=1346286 RepID=A0A1M5HWC5_9BACT|nr:hypothetical protein [Dysgonomonas macrotermitis]SHG20240.1 hypothetical protein SAMN05444362_11763 [Dysgonomonas macrotermitis]
MEVEKIKNLEQNKAFKRSFFSKSVWRKYALFPPALVLFVALFGVVYLYNMDQLISYYCIPFLVVLLLATIWFKSTRKYLINQELNNGESFQICLVLPLKKEKGIQYKVFTPGANRLNRYFLEKKQKELLNDPGKYQTLAENLKDRQVVELENEGVCITVEKQKMRWLSPRPMTNVDEYIVYYKNNIVSSISNRDMRRYL